MAWLLVLRSRGEAAAVRGAGEDVVIETQGLITGVLPVGLTEPPEHPAT